MIRFEILLPLYSNDGRPIPPEKFVQTDDELVHHFGATSTDTVVVRGRWLYQGTIYHDQLLRVRVDVEDTPENHQFFLDFKTILLERFEQIEIYIVSYPVDIL